MDPLACVFAGKSEALAAVGALFATVRHDACGLGCGGRVDAGLVDPFTPSLSTESLLQVAAGVVTEGTWTCR